MIILLNNNKTNMSSSDQIRVHQTVAGNFITEEREMLKGRGEGVEINF